MKAMKMNLLKALGHGCAVIFLPGEYEEEMRPDPGQKPVWRIEKHLLGIFAGLVSWTLIILIIWWILK